MTNSVVFIGTCGSTDVFTEFLEGLALDLE